MKKVSRHPVIQQCVDALPALKRQREIYSCELRRLLNRQSGHCTWCDGPVTKPRVNWCSEACKNAARLYGGITINNAVRDRDGNRCVHCGEPGHEVNHIHPVALGGGLCDESNLETLCKACHDRKSKNLGRAIRNIRQLHIKRGGL